MKFFTSYLLLLFVMTNNKCNPHKESEKKTFTFIDKKIDEDCTLYLMYFFKGDFMYRVATMDSCKSLTKEKYITAYDTLITNNLDKILIKRGKIIFETDFISGNDSFFRRRLIDITEKEFKTSGKIISEDSDRLTIELK